MSQLTFDELIGCCSYPWYGGGGNFTSGYPPMRIKGFDIVKGTADTRVCTIDKMYPFKLQRFFIDNSIFRNRTAAELECEPTPGGSFYYDTYFKLCKAHGIKTWWAPAGVFAWYEMPLNPKNLKNGVPQPYSRRKSLPIPHYADGTHADPFTKEAWDDIADHCMKIGKHFNGTGLLDYLELVGNEAYDFPWNTLLTGTPEIVAEGVYWCYKAVRSVNTELNLILPSGTSWNIDRLRELAFYVKRKFEAMGEQMPADLYHTSHNYLRDGSQSQGNGTTGITPEDANLQEWSAGMDQICSDYNLLGYLVGESGYGTDNDKQHAPDIEGLDRSTSAGACNIRFAAILGTSAYFKGVTFYHCRDLYDQGAYDYTGYCDSNWNWKKAMVVTNEFKAKYGDFAPVQYSFKGDISTLKIQRGTEVKYLQWSNKRTIGTATPLFQETSEPPTPPMRHPKKQGSTLVWSDTGERIILAELNSPETLLRMSLADFKAIIDYAVSVKLNGCYCTLYAGDKYSATLHPYNGTKQVNGKTFGDPATGFNETTLQDWKVKLEYAASKGMILHLLLSEKENHFIRTDVQEKEFIDKMVATFGHLPIIWDREEFPLGKDNWIQVYFDYLANADPNNVIAIHNNTGEKPWIGHAGRIHLLSIQADVNSMDSIIRTQTAAGFAVYASEGTGTHAAGDTTRAAKLRDAGGNLSSGAGIYIAPLDQDATLAQLKQYDSVFKTLSGTTTPTPNPTTMKIGYSTKSDRSDFKELVSGANLPAGNIYIEAREATPPVVFQLYKEGLSIKQQTENAAPFDSHGGQAFNATAGSYELQVKDKNTPSVGIAFTVGTVTPPPTEVKGTTFVKTADGKVKFNFEDGSSIIL